MAGTPDPDVHGLIVEIGHNRRSRSLRVVIPTALLKSLGRRSIPLFSELVQLVMLLTGEQEHHGRANWSTYPYEGPAISQNLLDPGWVFFHPQRQITRNGLFSHQLGAKLIGNSLKKSNILIASLATITWNDQLVNVLMLKSLLILIAGGHISKSEAEDFVGSCSVHNVAKGCNGASSSWQSSSFRGSKCSTDPPETEREVLP